MPDTANPMLSRVVPRLRNTTKICGWKHTNFVNGPRSVTFFLTDGKRIAVRLDVSRGEYLKIWKEATAYLRLNRKVVSNELV